MIKIKRGRENFVSKMNENIKDDFTKSALCFEKIIRSQRNR
jgi:hypothetical protein